MMLRRLVLPASVTALAAVACTPSPLPPMAPPPATPTKEVALADVGLSAEAMNRGVDPCDDFYAFACGNWVETTTIPSDQPRWMRSFNVIHDRNLQALQAILEASEKVDDDPVRRKLGDFYGSCMDLSAIEEAGLAPLAPLRSTIRRVEGATPAKSEKDPNDDASAWEAARRPAGGALSLEHVVAALHQRGVWVFFDIDSTQDFADATEMIAELDQNGLGLSDRDDYLKDDERAGAIRAFYVAHIARMLGLAGYREDDAKEAAEAIMRLETKIAKISKTRVERRDPEGMYNKIDRPGLIGLDGEKAFDWTAYLKALSLDGVEAITVTSTDYFAAIGRVARELPRDELVAYLEWQLLSTSATTLPQAFDDENFALVAKLTGQKERRPRWKRCVTAVDRGLGELLAQPFVAKNFTDDSKAAVETMVGAISDAFAKRVKELPWMTAETKAKALEKREKMAFLIGFPDRWKHYDFEVKPDRYAGNVLRAVEFDIQRELGKIGEPVDRNNWFMTPPTVNAYYSPLRNQMVFPAGILQPPFYQPDASIAVNLGGIGMVVGHELTHGFDDQGSQFDAYGNLTSWWTEKDRRGFEERTACVVDQYNRYEAIEGVNLNGELTLGENIADAGGVKLAFAAYRSLRVDAKEKLVADGFDEDQQFFLSVAQVWCAKYREEFARLRAQNDPHSQPNWRVNGSLRNSTEFAEAFSCQAGTPMNPEDRCTVW